MGIGHWFLSWALGWGGIAAAIAAAAWLLWYWTPDFLSESKALILHVAVAASVFLAAQTYFSATAFHDGYRAAINAVAANNKEATDAVHEATARVDACNALGRHWSTVSGLCDE